MDQQQPIVRDFLGLGKLVTDDQAPDKGTPVKPSFHGGLHQLPSTNRIDFRGAKHAACNMGYRMVHNFPFLKAPEEMYMEGCAENYGVPSASRQWQGMMPGTNTTIGGPPARLLGSDAHAKSSGMPLTIFYGGLVNVYNNIDADKAQSIMHMAGNGNLLSSNGSTPPLGVPHVLGAPGFCQPAGGGENFCFNAETGPIQFASDQASQNCPAANKQFEAAMPNTASSASSPQPTVPRALPLARKASLARFLEKRKERMQLLMPYVKKQLPPTQGDPRLGSFHGAMLAQLYEEYFRRPSTMVFNMPEHMAPHNNMTSCGMPPKE